MAIEKQDKTPSPGDSAATNPYTIPFDEATRQLTSSLRIADGGWNEKGTLRKIPGRMGTDGVRVITYTFDIPPASGYESFNAEERQLTTRLITTHIPPVANIRFEEAPPDAVAQADIRYFKNISPNPQNFGNELGEISVLSKDILDPYTILHETLHTLGLSHPGANGQGEGAGGKTPGYNTDTTLMSYNIGSIAKPGLGPFDVAVLQFLYGVPKNSGENPQRLSAQDLSERRFVYSSEPVTLELRGAGQANSGKLTVDDGRIDGGLKLLGTIYDKPVHLRTVGETQIGDVLANDTTNIALALTGNTLPNRLQGGNRDDTLTARGGGDTLTGNNGKDTFIIDTKSGLANVITDFKPEDTLRIMPSIAKTDMNYVDNYMLNGSPCAGTRVDCLDAQGTKVASVFVAGIKPDNLKLDMPEAPPPEKKSDGMENPSGEHPSGLSPIIGGVRRGISRCNK